MSIPLCLTGIATDAFMQTATTAAAATTPQLTNTKDLVKALYETQEVDRPALVTAHAHLWTAESLLALVSACAPSDRRRVLLAIARVTTKTVNSADSSQWIRALFEVPRADRADCIHAFMDILSDVFTSLTPLEWLAMLDLAESSDQDGVMKAARSKFNVQIASRAELYGEARPSVRVHVACAAQSVVTHATAPGTAVDVKVGQCGQDVETTAHGSAYVHVGDVSGNVVTVATGGSAHVSGGTVGGGVYTLAVGEGQDAAAMLEAVNRLRNQRLVAKAAKANAPLAIPDDASLHTDGKAVCVPPTATTQPSTIRDVKASLDTSDAKAAAKPTLPDSLRDSDGSVEAVHTLFLEVERITAAMVSIESVYDSAGNWERASLDVNHIRLRADWPKAFRNAHAAYMALPNRSPYIRWFNNTRPAGTFLGWTMHAHHITEEEAGSSAAQPAVAEPVIAAAKPEPPPPSYEATMACDGRRAD